MERLTIQEIIEHCERKIEGYEKKVNMEFLYQEPLTNLSKGYWEHKQVSEYLKELMKYRELEEQGRLLKLPCNVGDTVWVVTSPINVFDYGEYDGDAEYEVYESFLSSVSYYTSGEQFRIYAKVTNSFIAAYFRECDFGKSIFLTREEAEKKLEEVKNAQTSMD